MKPFCLILLLAVLGLFICSCDNKITNPDKSVLSVSCSPNPFSESTTFTLNGRAGETAVLDIFNIKGHLIRHINNMSSGHSQIWNGTDDDGHQVYSGVYFYKLTTPSVNSTGRLFLIR